MKKNVKKVCACNNCDHGPGEGAPAPQTPNIFDDVFCIIGDTDENGHRIPGYVFPHQSEDGDPSSCPKWRAFDEMLAQKISA